MLAGSVSLAAATAAGIAFPRVARAASDVIKVGVISDQSGPAAAFGEATEFALKQARDFVKNGLQVGGKTYQVEFLLRDGQSSTNRNAAVATELMNWGTASICSLGTRRSRPLPRVNWPQSTRSR